MGQGAEGLVGRESATVKRCQNKLDGDAGPPLLRKALLTEAVSIARAAGNDRLTLMVGSFNERAYGLYEKSGFTEWERRPFTPFPGSDEPGEWILMAKGLSGNF